MTHLIDFSGRRILVSGASSGIGRQTAITLSRLGASVIIVARRRNMLEETLSMMETGAHSLYECDLCEVSNIGSLINTIVSECGALDGLFYAAGVVTALPLAQITPEKIQQVFNVNFFGFIEMVRQISKKGRYNARMRIVGVSSIASLCGDPAHTVYSASKAAIDGAIRCMAKELAAKGICINSIAPAMTNTNIYDAYRERYGEDSKSERELLQRQYLGIADPQDIANAAAFLLSQAAKFITGVCMPVDGGYTSN